MTDDEPRTCFIHGTSLVWEEGGDDMPTIRGRWYCEGCNYELMREL